MLPSSANTTHILISNAPHSSSFTLAKSLYNKSKEADDSVGSDDITVEQGFPSQRQRMSIMISVPEKDIDEDDAPIEAIKKLNNMISCLINKVSSVRIGPWNYDKKVTKKQLLKRLPDDIDITERYAHNFNRFISPDDRAYC